MKFKLVEHYTSFDLDEAQRFIQEYIYDAVDDLKSAPLEEYQKWFRDTSAYVYECNFDALDAAVKDTYIEAIDCGKINRPKTMVTSQLQEYLELNSNLLKTDVDVLMENCPDHLKYELTLVLDKINGSLKEELLTEAQSEAQRQENKKYKKKIHDLDNSILESDYVVHHIDKTKKLKLENGETIQLTDYSNCVLLPKIRGDSNVIHQAVHGALVCGDLDSYIQTLQQCEVIKENEDNSISRVPLEDFIKNSIK